MGSVQTDDSDRRGFYFLLNMYIFRLFDEEETLSAGNNLDSEAYRLKRMNILKHQGVCPVAADLPLSGKFVSFVDGKGKAGIEYLN